MATAYITEFNRAAPGGGCGLQIAEQPPIASQTVAIGVETKSTAFNTATSFIRVHVDAICSILVGTAPTAATTDARMAADQTEYFGVQPGGGMKISIISNT